MICSVVIEPIWKASTRAYGARSPMMTLPNKWDCVSICITLGPSETLANWTRQGWVHPLWFHPLIHRAVPLPIPLHARSVFQPQTYSVTRIFAVYIHFPRRVGPTDFVIDICVPLRNYAAFPT